MQILLLLHMLLTALCYQSASAQRFQDSETGFRLQRRTYQPSITDLQHAALDFVTDLKHVDPSYGQNVKVLLIGGAAIMHKFPAGRQTQDVDFLVEVTKPAPPPKTLKEKLATALPKKYKFAGGTFVYELGPGKDIGIDAVDAAIEDPATKPSGLKSLNSITSVATIPIISNSDLLVMKMSSCSLRPTADKCRNDAQDAVSLLKAAGKVSLTSSQKQAINHEVVLQAVAKNGGVPEDWLKTALGLAPSRSPSPQPGPRTPSPAPGPRTPSPKPGPSKSSSSSSHRKREIAILEGLSPIFALYKRHIEEELLQELYVRELLEDLYWN